MCTREAAIYIPIETNQSNTRWIKVTRKQWTGWLDFPESTEWPTKNLAKALKLQNENHPAIKCIKAIVKICREFGDWCNFSAVQIKKRGLTDDELEIGLDYLRDQNLRHVDYQGSYVTLKLWILLHEAGGFDFKILRKEKTAQERLREAAAVLTEEI